MVGCAFDGNWEAMSGDIAFESQLQRTISVDARYILFIIDKFAGASNIINELTLFKSEKVDTKKVNSRVKKTYRSVWSENSGVRKKYRTYKAFKKAAIEWNNQNS